jgi:hypothetical protein
MTFIHRIDARLHRCLSPNEFYERCLQLAEEADRAGFPVAAEDLFHIAIQAVNDPAELSNSTEGKDSSTTGTD